MSPCACETPADAPAADPARWQLAALICSATPCPASELRVTWLGHSTMLLEIEGRRVLVDPVWGERASPFTFVGPKRFLAPPRLPLAELPAVGGM